MSDESLQRKLKEASLLASKFFLDLSVIFDNKAPGNQEPHKNLKKVSHVASSSVDAQTPKTVQKANDSTTSVNEAKQSVKQVEGKQK